MTRFLPLALLLVFAASARADDKPDTKAGDEMMYKYLARLTKEISGRFLDGAKTRAEWERKLPRLRREYLDMLGLWPLPEKTPLHATVTGTVEHEGIVVEKLHYQSRPGLYVTANLYRPKDPKGRLPAILYVCGHGDRGRDGNKTAYQQHGLWFAHNGYVCLTLDTLQLGEVPGVHHGTYGIRNENYAIRREPVETRWWWQALGYTPAGVECWNGVRGIDYLVSRPDVDPERIGVTGRSGGGATTVWVAAADERVKVAAPVSGMSDLQTYVTDKVINGHCDCMFLVNTYQWEWTTIAALIAPRPLLFANSDEDKIFPMDGNRRVMARLRQVYEMYGKPDLVEEFVNHSKHEDKPELRVAAFQWMNKHLKNDTAPIKYEPYKPLEGKELRVFPEDKDLPKDALNGKIDETFVKRAEVKLPVKGQFAEWKKGMIDRLTGRCFGTFPKLHYIPAADEWPRGGILTVGMECRTESGITVESYHLDDVGARAAGKADDFRMLVVAKAEDVRAPGDATPTWLKEVPSGKDRVDLCPRGWGKPWTTKSPPNYIDRAHALLGRTADTGRLYDTLARVRTYYLRQEETRIRIVGRGQAGIIAAYAALLEPSMAGNKCIKEVVIIDPPTSHKDGPIFLNVLRVLDIPEALGLLAPDVKLTLINAKGKAFDRTEQLYKLAGAEDMFERK